MEAIEYLAESFLHLSQCMVREPDGASTLLVIYSKKRFLTGAWVVGSVAQRWTATVVSKAGDWTRHKIKNFFCTATLSFFTLVRLLKLFYFQEKQL